MRRSMSLLSAGAAGVVEGGAAAGGVAPLGTGSGKVVGAGPGGAEPSSGTCAPPAQRAARKATRLTEAISSRAPPRRRLCLHLAQPHKTEPHVHRELASARVARRDLALLHTHRHRIDFHFVKETAQRRLISIC